MCKLVCLAFMTCLSGAAANGADPRFLLEDLGTLGGPGSLAEGINSRGQVIGYASTSQLVNHAFLYTDGHMHDLGTLGGSMSDARGINDAGQIVGITEVAGGFLRAFLFDGSLHDIGTLGGSYAGAQALNRAGQIVGSSTLAGDAPAHAFLASGGFLTDLGTLGGTTSVAMAINDSKQIAGWSYTAGSVYRHAFLYQLGGMADLGTLAGAAAYSMAYGISASGQVVGSAQTFGGMTRAFLSSGGPMKNLGALGSTDDSCAYAINDGGEIVGESGGRAFLYSNGRMIDLETLILEPRGYTLSRGTAINNAGQIAVIAFNPSQQPRAAVLTPNNLVTAAVGLTDFAGPSEGLVATCTVSRPDGTPLDSWLSPISIAIWRRLPEPIGAGENALRIKVSHWLAKRVGFVAGQALNLPVALVNGDVDGDNSVTVFDYSLLSDAFDSVPGDANWNPDADLDGDEAVTVFDFAILSENFDIQGD